MRAREIFDAIMDTLFVDAQITERRCLEITFVTLMVSDLIMHSFDVRQQLLLSGEREPTTIASVSFNFLVNSLDVGV